MRAEISAVLNFNGHSFPIFTSLYLKKMSKHPCNGGTQKASLTKKTILWKLRRTFSGGFEILI